MVVARCRQTLVDGDLASGTGVTRRTAALALRAATAVVAGRVGVGEVGHLRTIGVDALLDKADVALREAAPAGLALQVAVEVAGLVGLAGVDGQALDGAVRAVHVGRTGYFGLTVLAVEA